MADEKESGGTEWMQKLWRPAMGWMYMIICLADMIVFPVLWSLLQAFTHTAITQWNPLTLQGAGLFHIAMGAVLGISAFGRTQEKLAGTAANPSSTTQTVNNNMSGNVAGGFGSNQGGTFGGASNGGFGSNNSSFGGAPAFGAPASGGFGSSTGGFGSPAPASGGFGANAPSIPASTGFSSGGFGSTPPTTTASGKKIVPDFDQPAI
jgi:hypothetical protein